MPFESVRMAKIHRLKFSASAEIDKTGLHQAFSRQVWQRRTNDKGFIRVGRWKIYVKAGLPKTPVELTSWEDNLQAEYRQSKLAEYDCRWDEKRRRPQSIEKPRYFEMPYVSNQAELFKVDWSREPMEEVRAEKNSLRSVFLKQLKLPFSEAV